MRSQQTTFWMREERERKMQIKVGGIYGAIYTSIMQLFIILSYSTLLCVKLLFVFDSNDPIKVNNFDEDDDVESFNKKR